MGLLVLIYPKRRVKMEKNYVNAKKLSEAIGVSLNTVDRLSRYGLIPCIEITTGVKRITRRYCIDDVVESMLYTPSQVQAQESK